MKMENHTVVQLKAIAKERGIRGYYKLIKAELIRLESGDIRISIASQDVFTHPSERYLIFEGRLTKADGTTYVNADEVALTNNAIMHLLAELTITYRTS